MDKAKILESIVNNPETGFLGIEKIYRKAWEYGISRADVKEYLDSDALHQIHTKTKQVYQRIIPENENDMWEVDLIDMTDYNRFNKKEGQKHAYGWIMNVIDTFSKVVYSVPLFSKNDKDTRDGFKLILDSTYDTPKSIQTDSGPEFDNKLWNKLMR